MPSVPRVPFLDLESTRNRILNEISVLLSEGPLYKTYKYEGDLWVREPMRYFAFPDTLRTYCSDDLCNTVQVWQAVTAIQTGNGYAQVNTLTSTSFLCRNCKRSHVAYFLSIEADQRGGKIIKVGQWPPLSREPDPVVSAGWSPHDKQLYRDAMTFRNSNKGIGALPYIRRIIETHVIDILTLISDAHKRQPIPGFDEAVFEKVRLSHRFTDKLDFARDYLPVGLVPAGSPNPIGTLYDLISDGLHERTEDECVDIFDRCKVAFEFVVRKLTEAKRDDEAYIESVRLLKKP